MTDRWDYLMRSYLTLALLLEKIKLDGRDGWELVNVIYAADAEEYVAYLKKRVQ